MKKILLILILSLYTMFCIGQNAKHPVVFYLKNLPAERIGEFSDSHIKAELDREGFLVIDVDCSSFPRTSPHLEEMLMQFHIKAEALLQRYNTEGCQIDMTAVYYVPEGYMIARQVPVWNILEHGAEGSVEWVMETWNNHIVKRYGMPPAESPEQMTNPDGSPIDWNLYLDVIYPSGNALSKVPLLLNFGSASPMMSSFKPFGKLERLYRNIFPLGFLTTGYAFALADHCYNPLARTESWKHFKQYTLDDFNAHASTTAFIRYLRANAKEYNLDGKIGVMGISKASLSAVYAADRNNASYADYLYFNGRPNEKIQPWSGVSSYVDVAYAAAGIGSERAFQYVGENMAPLITSAGLTDEYNQWEVYPEVVRAMIKADHTHLSFWMEDMGHTYPCMGTDAATGENRYILFKRFFDHYLKKATADPLYILPAENASDVDGFGQSRVIPDEDLLPKDHARCLRPYWANTFGAHYAGFLMRHATGENKFVFFNGFYETFLKGMEVNWPVLASDDVFYDEMPGLNPLAPITVRFLDEYSLNEIEHKVKVYDVVDNTCVEGSWSVSMRNTCFTFRPVSPLSQGGRYAIAVPETIRSVSGKSPSSANIRTFVVTR